MQMPLPKEDFPDNFTVFRLGLILYNHIIEMNAPYEVIANLLRFHLNEGYYPNPFYKYLSSDQKKRASRFGVSPRQKVSVITHLSKRSGIDVGCILNEFINWDLRNAIAHSDYILTEDSFRSRGEKLSSSFKISLDEIDKLITSAKAFISAFFVLEREARLSWGGFAERAVPYDPIYKGLMEVLADGDGLMTGYKVHWPNGEESYYRRTPDGVDMVNCFLSSKNETVELFVGMYAQQRSEFSPLVENGREPVYSPIANGEVPYWNLEAAVAKQEPFPAVKVSIKDNQIVQRAVDSDTIK
ncbi:MAG: hypothetical protein KF780_10385 [Sphingomonas sp.]|nr:hypothetical protein [Sphingomonas sp.]